MPLLYFLLLLIFVVGVSLNRLLNIDSSAILLQEKDANGSFVDAAADALPSGVGEAIRGAQGTIEDEAIENPPTAYGYFLLVQSSLNLILWQDGVTIIQTAL